MHTHTYNVALSPQRECNRCVCWHTSSIRPASDIRFRNKKENGLLKDFGTMEVDHRPSRSRAPWPVTLIIKHTMAYNTIRSSTSDDGRFISVRPICVITRSHGNLTFAELHARIIGDATLAREDVSCPPDLDKRHVTFTPHRKWGFYISLVSLLVKCLHC